MEQVVEASAATAIREGQVVLSVNLKSDDYQVNALRNVPVGAEIILNVTAASEEWNDVDYAVGALYSLVENGAVVSSLQAGAALSKEERVNNIKAEGSPHRRGPACRRLPGVLHH